MISLLQTKYGLGSLRKTPTDCTLPVGSGPIYEQLTQNFKADIELGMLINPLYIAIKIHTSFKFLNLTGKKSGNGGGEIYFIIMNFKAKILNFAIGTENNKIDLITEPIYHVSFGDSLGDDLDINLIQNCCVQGIGNQVMSDLMKFLINNMINSSYVAIKSLLKSFQYLC